MLNPITLEPIPTEFDETAAANMAIFADYYKRLRLLALSAFQWHDLPEGMNERYLEGCLYWYGRAALIKDPELGYLNTKCTPSETLNIYGDALEYNCYGIGYTRDFALDDMALVRNNYEMLPTDSTIQIFAGKLYEAERTINVNIKAQKTPVLILCDRNQRLSLKNIYMKYDGNEPVIFGDKNLDPNTFQVLETGAPFVAANVEAYKRNVWSEALSFLGINNVDTEKKERLVTGEVTANNQMIELSAETMLLTRQQAAEDFNKKYNTNITVTRRTFRKEETVINGTLHDPASEPDRE